MAVAVSPTPDAASLTAPERALARWLRIFAGLFALAVANMATITVCAWLAAGDVRGRRALAYPIVVSKLVSSGTGLLLYVQWTHAFPLLTIALVDLPIAVILLRALGRARPAA